jgi:hypothetical protein
VAGPGAPECTTNGCQHPCRPCWQQHCWLAACTGARRKPCPPVVEPVAGLDSLLCSLWPDYLHQGSRRRLWLPLLPCVVWLASLPNGPYLLTGFWHLQQRAAVPPWYDIGLLAACAWTGLILAIFSLRAMPRPVQQLAGSFVGWCFTVGAAGLAGLGVYLAASCAEIAGT